MIYALERLGVHPILTRDEAEIRSADKVIFPGVGEASTTMKCLKELGLDKLIPTLTQPVLGVCLGMQLMCKHSEEGDVPCLGIFDEVVTKFVGALKIPHIGWNCIKSLKGDLYKGLEEDDYVYYVHSFYVPLCEYTVATTDYILPYSGSLHKGNFYATQFHPEKSGSVGEKILANFLKV